MTEEYDVQEIMNSLREKEEMDPDRHDGCHELMRETIKALYIHPVYAMCIVTGHKIWSLGGSQITAEIF